MKKNCQFCGNKNFKKNHVQYIYKHDGKMLFVNGVPCEQCEFCGEQYFEGKILHSIEEEFNQIHLQGKKTKKIQVPVEDYLELQAK